MAEQNLLQQTIYRLVYGIEALDSIEQTHKQDALQWIQSNAPLFRVKKPDIPPKHLVSYFVVVDPLHKSILLVNHIKAQLWLPPGGHVLPNEHPKATVLREVKEELGQEGVFLRNNSAPFFVTVTETVGLTPGHIDVSLWYLLRADRHQYIHFDRSEFNDVEWFTFDEILEADPIIFDPHLQRFTKKLLQQYNF